MNWSKKYVHTDIAEEFPDEDDGKKLKGITVKEEHTASFPISRIEITDERASKALMKPIGRYISINVGKIWLESDLRFDTAAKTVARELRNMAQRLCPSLTSVLVVGLGNSYIISDAIGPLSVKGLTVNRHIEESDPVLFEKLKSLTVSAITPGVTAQTGMEAAELVKNAVKTVNPSLVLCIDALAAQDVLRLGTTVQLSDTGISPGSGIGNKRKEINKSSLGVPVISLGVPTVVDSSTLVYGMLEKAGITDINSALKAELENGRSFFVTLKDADTVITEMARLISLTLTIAFSNE